MRRRLVALAIAVVLPLPGLAAEVTVQPGETLSQIADRLGISMTRLMKLNGITNPDHVESGSKLTVPNSVSSSGRAKGASTSSNTKTTKVTVKDGETLSEIADRHGMSINELVRLNDLSNADHVETGSTLRVKAIAVASSRSADGPSSYRKGASEHVVQPGQNLSTIAEGYGVPMSRLVAINGLQDADHVEVGMRLRLKGNPPTSAAPVAPSQRSSSPAPSGEALPSRSVAPGPETSPRATTAPVVAPAVVAVPRATVPQADAPSTVTFPQTRPATGTTAMANPVVASPVVARPVVTRPVVATPVAATPVIATPVVAKPVITAPAPRASVARASQAPVSSVLPAEASSRTDWRPYGPLQVDWANWQPMGGSLVAPTISNKGETLYLAINCSARKMNATSSNGDWKTWEDPRANFEVKLVNDRCRQSRL
ncbi:MAG: LysM peptidoglycan-binding domain-containing protein [Cyanobacteria bacterium]|nr:LysM peptidoglycan-binding domain-containing protein [Cyanobacteriota bacterium]